jgi:hypothetical protein
MIAWILSKRKFYTVSLIPYKVYKIWKGLFSAIISNQASHHEIVIATKMLQKLNDIFGTGEGEPW